jgi:hypothetical protein
VQCWVWLINYACLNKVNGKVAHVALIEVSQPSFHASQAFQDASIPALHLDGLILSAIPVFV